MVDGQVLGLAGKSRHSGIPGGSTHFMDTIPFKRLRVRARTTINLEAGQALTDIVRWPSKARSE